MCALNFFKKIAFFEATSGDQTFENGYIEGSKIVVYAYRGCGKYRFGENHLN